jgi:DNA-binding response OmpR family regulator
MRLSAVVVDLTGVGEDPWRWLARLTRSVPALPVLICTASSTVSERVRALQLGADGWLGTAVDPRELVARIERVACRPEPTTIRVEPINAGELTISFDDEQAHVDGQSARLTPNEFRLLCLLAANDGNAMERTEICWQLWGHAMPPGDRAIDAIVASVRGKLARISPQWRYVHTRVKVGYRFGAEPKETKAQHEIRFAAASNSLATTNLTRG